MGVTDRFRLAWTALTRSEPLLPFDEWASWFSYQGNVYGLLGASQTLASGQEEARFDFGWAFRTNGIVFACMLARQSIFSEARFQFRQIRNGRPGDLFGTAELAVVEHPWPNATTGDLLARAIQDVDLTGNFYAVRRGDQIKRLNPLWVSIIIGSTDDIPDQTIRPEDIDAGVAGYVYHPGGRHSGQRPVPLDVAEVCHFAPIPDPRATYKGISWLTPILREVQSDSAATSHKQRFFEQGATPNMIVKLDVALDEFDAWVTKFRTAHEGAENAYKTLFLSQAVDADVVGANFQQMEFKVTQGAGESRIAAAAGMHPTIVGLSEGLQGSSLNTGNFGAARRITADKTFRPLWRNFAGSMAPIVNVPPDAELYYDDRDIAFLREDRKDAAEIQQMKAETITKLVREGFTWQSAKAAVESEDMGLLEHSGLYSVQLQSPAALGLANGQPAQPSPNGQPAEPIAVP